MNSLALAFALTPALCAVIGCAGSKPAPPAPAMVDMHHEEHGEAGESEADEEHERVASADRDKADADGIVRRGQPLTASLEATPVSAAIAKAKDLDGKRVKLTGKVAQVCAKSGCWFVVQGDKDTDKIKISGRAKDIYVPHAAVGMNAVVEGTLKLRDDNTIAIDVAGLEMTKG